ncbi:MAG: hypothetical protein M1423_03240, partial [Acidobacteria bacterium]|nr:hypothetical protein [Acidobacteriota bacterium]
MQPTKPRDLLKTDAKRKDEYRRFSLVHLTAYSVFWLTQWGIPTTYENVSVLNGRLFPDDFSMQGFRELPDGLRTNRSLLQMRPKYRGFATSDPRGGVHLTEKGRASAVEVSNTIGPPSFEGKIAPVGRIEIDPRRPNKDKEKSRNPANIIQEVRSKILFRRFKEGKLAEAEIVHLLGLVGLYDHTLPSELRKSFRQLRSDAQDVGDSEVLTFLDSVSERFRGYLDRLSK